MLCSMKRLFRIMNVDRSIGNLAPGRLVLRPSRAQMFQGRLTNVMSISQVSTCPIKPDMSTYQIKPPVRRTIHQISTNPIKLSISTYLIKLG